MNIGLSDASNFFFKSEPIACKVLLKMMSRKLLFLIGLGFVDRRLLGVPFRFVRLSYFVYLESD